MTIQDLGSIGELIAALATVATLIYLASQVRAARHSTDFLISQGISQQFNHTNGQITQDPELAELFTRGLSDPDSLSDVESIRFDFLLYQYFHTHNMILELGAEGIIGERWVRGSTTDMKALFGFAGMRRFFDKNAHWWGQEIATIFDSTEVNPDLTWRDR